MDCLGLGAAKLDGGSKGPPHWGVKVVDRVRGRAYKIRIALAFKEGERGKEGLVAKWRLLDNAAQGPKKPQLEQE